MNVMMTTRYYHVKFSYVIDDETVVEVTSSDDLYDSSVTFEIPSDVLQNRIVEKWTLYNADTDTIARCAENVTSLTFNVSDNVEYIAYIKTENNDALQKSTADKR